MSLSRIDDGLTEAEIKLAIEESAERRESTFDAKLSTHREEMTRRMDRVEDGLRDNREALSDLQSTVAVVNVSTDKQTILLESIVSQGKEWHEDDVKFRLDLTTRVGKIETDQIELTAQVKRLKWVGWAFYGFGKSCKFGYEKICEVGLWKVVSMAILLWILKVLSPVLYQLALKLVKS